MAFIESKKKYSSDEAVSVMYGAVYEWSPDEGMVFIKEMDKTGRGMGPENSVNTGRTVLKSFSSFPYFSALFIYLKVTLTSKL